MGSAAPYIFLTVFLVILIWVFLWIVPVRLWVSAIAANVRISLVNLIGMRLRRVNPVYIVNPLINASKAGLDLTPNQLEAHYLANGHVDLVIQAMISADKANIPLNWEKATAIDLAGRNVLEAVQMSVKPAVIDCPDPSKGKNVVEAVAKNGIQLKAKARVTVRANLDRLVGGATEETIIARVGEGIVTSIGSAESHKEVLENPDVISQRVLGRGLDSGTGFEILSIDIADIDVGENIGAKLDIDEAEAQKRMAQARAEERRAMAVAAEQEFSAREQEMRAKVVEAEAQVPLAIAEAFKTGKIGVMDYYNMKNLMADTSMRDSIAEGSSQHGGGTEDPNH